jgi:hypothetical protein
MTDQLQAAAKAGDIKAIEALMNKAFEPKGLTVRVTNSGRLLKVVMRGKTAPDRALLPAIKAGLANISPQGFDQFVVTARATGKSDAWSYQGDFTKDEQPLPKPKTASTPPAPQPKPLPKANSVSSKPEVSATTSDAITSQEQSKAWYQQNWLVISLLILFPLAGIPLTWATKWPKINKIGASAISGIWLLSSVLLSSFPDPQTTTAQESDQSSSTELAGAPENTAPAPATDRTFADAINTAMSAAEAAQIAKTSDEWKNVENLWYRAITLMNTVPQTSVNYQSAQQKATEYQVNLDYARQQADSPTKTLNLSKAELSTYFSQPNLDFSFKSVPLADGSPRLIGTASNHPVTIELYGSSNLATEAAMITFVGEGVSPSSLAIINLEFLNKIAPGYDWEEVLSQTMSELFESGSKEPQSIIAGDKIISIQFNKVAETGVYRLFIKVKPSE